MHILITNSLRFHVLYLAFKFLIFICNKHEILAHVMTVIINRGTECASISEIRWLGSFHFLAHRATDVRTSIEIRGRPRGGARNGSLLTLLPSRRRVRGGGSVAECLAPPRILIFSRRNLSQANRDKAERKRAPESVRRAVGGTRVKEDSFAARANWLAISLRERALTAPRTFVTFAPVTVGLFLSRQAPAAVTRKQGDALCGSIAEQIARPNLRGFFSPSTRILPLSRA